MLDTTIEAREPTPALPVVRESIPAGLDEMDPGPVLGALLSAVDVDGVSGRDRLVVLRAQQRQVSHDQARLLATMASVVDAVVDEYETDLDHPLGLSDAADAAATEIRVALHLTRRAADRELEFALELRRRLPTVHAALHTGRVDRRRAGVLVNETIHLTVAEARRVAGRVLNDASRLTTGQLRARIQRLCMEVDPDQARRRYNTAVEARRVVVEPTESGTAHLLGLDLPPDRVAEIRDRIEAITRSLRGSGETRSIDQIRADVYLDLLTGTDSHTNTGSGRGRRGVVDLHVDLDTLAEMSDTPGDLSGYGPVVADVTRRIARDHTDGEWRYTITDQGRTVATGVTQRRPTTDQRRAIQTRDRTCIFPGCRMPAIRSDLDHRIPYAQGGKTTVGTMGALCRHDHCHKHAYGWTYRRLPNGDYRWTSPLGWVTIVPAGGNRSP